jgi:hypothetical protein
VLDPLLFKVGRAHERNRVLVEPFDKAANSLERIRLMRLDYDTDAPYDRLRHQFSFGSRQGGFWNYLDGSDDNRPRF